MAAYSGASVNRDCDGLQVRRERKYKRKKREEGKSDFPSALFFEKRSREKKEKKERSREKKEKKESLFPSHARGRARPLACEGKKDRLCVCVCERERESVCVYVCVCVFMLVISVSM